MVFAEQEKTNNKNPSGTKSDMGFDEAKACDATRVRELAAALLATAITVQHVAAQVDHAESLLETEKQKWEQLQRWQKVLIKDVMDHFHQNLEQERQQQHHLGTTQLAEMRCQHDMELTEMYLNRLIPPCNTTPAALSVKRAGPAEAEGSLEKPPNPVADKEKTDLVPSTGKLETDLLDMLAAAQTHLEHLERRSQALEREENKWKQLREYCHQYRQYLKTQKWLQRWQNLDSQPHLRKLALLQEVSSIRNVVDQRWASKRSSKED